MIAKTPWARNKNRDKELAEQKNYLDNMVKLANECLNDAKFIEYKQMFIRYRDQVIEDIVLLNEEDPIQYAFKCRQLVDTLKALRLLLSSVEEDAQRKVE